MKEDIIIGILNDYDYTNIVTIKELYDHVMYDTLCIYTLAQYCDRRYATDLTRFTYDPFTGEKIDWKEVKKELLKIDEEHKHKIK
jgi:hypothetical protein